MVMGHYPKTIEEVCTLLNQYEDTLLVSGGTDVMVVKKTATHMIFLNGVKALKKVSKQEGILSIGAGVVYSDLLEDKGVPGILKKAIRQIASPAIRHAGTIAGNICNASPAGDTLPVLYALSANVVLASLKEGEIVTRKVPIDAFILGIRKTDLAQNEVVVAIEILEENWQGMNYEMYEKVGARKSEAISKLSFVGLAEVKDQKLSKLSIAFGAVNITAVRRKELEAKWLGQDIEVLKAHEEEILKDYAAYIKPIDDQRSTALYRQTVCLNLLQAFLSQFA